MAAIRRQKASIRSRNARPKEELTLHTFSAEASAGLGGPEWLRLRRAAGYEAFAAASLPSEAEEVWRYTPIDHLALEEFTAPGSYAVVSAPEKIRTAGEDSAQECKVIVKRVPAFSTNKEKDDSF